MIVFLFTGVIAVVLLRNELATAEDAVEETGWKLVHADVFRKPHHSKMLAVCIGSGVQTLGMGIVTLFFALLGFLSAAHGGGLLQSVMLIFTLMGAVAGYEAAKHLLRCLLRPCLLCSSCGSGVLCLLCSFKHISLSEGDRWSSQCEPPIFTSKQPCAVASEVPCRSCQFRWVPRCGFRSRVR